MVKCLGKLYVHGYDGWYLTPLLRQTILIRAAQIYTRYMAV